MAKKITIEGTNHLHSINNAWGGKNNTNSNISAYGTTVPPGAEWGMNREEVERFIKENLSSLHDSVISKVGYFAIEKIGETNYLLGFPNQSIYLLWKDNSDSIAPLVKQEMETHTPYLSRLSTDSNPDDTIILLEPEYSVNLKFTSLMYEAGDYIEAGLPGIVTFLRSLDGITYTEVGQETIPSRDSYKAFEVGKYLLEGQENYIAARAVLRTSNATYTSPQINIATIVYTSLDVLCKSDWAIPLSIDLLVLGFPLTYVTNNAVDTTLHVSITGNNGSLTVEKQVPKTKSNQPETYYFYDTSNIGINYHGIHEVTAYLTCNDGHGLTLTGDSITNRFMVVNPSTAGENLDKVYLMILNEITEIENFVQTKICDYAVYNPTSNDPIPIGIELVSSISSAEPDVYYSRVPEIEPKILYKLETSVDIETENTTNLFAFLKFSYNDEDIMERSGFEHPYHTIIVNNSLDFIPKAGVSFILNPRLKSNEDPNYETIINNKTEEVVTSTWTGFSWGTTDGWVVDDDGYRVLRVRAGQRLNILYDPFAQFLYAPNSSMTFEIDFKTYNITDEHSPIFSISENIGTTEKRGLILCPLVGNLFTQTQHNVDETNFRWQEGVRTHIAVNITTVQTDNNDALISLSQNPNPNTNRMFARVFINGNIEREIMLPGTNSSEFCSAVLANNGIIIGQDNADIDIYQIRCYQNTPLEARDVLTDYIVSLPTAEEKLRVNNENKIYKNGLIDVNMVKAAGKRVLILHGKEPYLYDTSASGNWWEIHQYDKNGIEIPELSGTICKDTGFSEVKRLGSTANTYYYSNLQTKISDAIGTIDVPLSNLHSSIKYSDPIAIQYEENGLTLTRRVVEIYGGNLGQNDLVSNASKRYPFHDGMVTVPDGWIDGNGKYRGVGFMIAENTPLADKLVLKINYASSMQSHVVGGTRLYNDLHRVVVGENPIQKRIPTARVSKYTEPVFFFTQLTDNDPVKFRGMGNFGAGKMDKPTWGYVKSEFPLFAMVEGSDNDLALTDYLVPFTIDPSSGDACVTYDKKEEGWVFHDLQSLDFDGGATNDNKVPISDITNKVMDTWNWVYLHAPNLKMYTGSFAEFLDSENANDTKSKYWCTTGPDAYRIKRYDPVNELWINAGFWNGQDYDILDLRTWEVTSGAYAYGQALLTQHENFIAAIIEDAKATVGEHYNAESLKFHYAFQNHFMAGTDNCSKNTYFVLMPFTVDGETKWLWELHQDDVDTILITDNNGRSTKPYYIDRMHPYSEEDQLESCYKGGNNLLFNLCEAMWEREGSNSEIADMLGSIFRAMVGLVTPEDEAAGYSKSVFGCMDKYMLSTLKYFPQMAYNEQARIRYEMPETLGYVSQGKGARGISPITQSMGSQLEAETLFIKRRLVYMGSYAAWGEFVGDNDLHLGVSNDSFNFQPGLLPGGGMTPYSFNVTPHVYIYPSGSIGQTKKCPRHRVAPNTEWPFSMGNQASGDTGVTLYGINYYRKIGNIGDLSTAIGITASVKGNRLVELVAEPTTTYEENGKTVGAFRPNQMIIEAQGLKLLNLHNSGVGGTLDLRAMRRLLEIDLRGTYITSVSLPEGIALTDLSVPATLNSLVINRQPALLTLTVEGVDNLTTLEITGVTPTIIRGSEISKLALLGECLSLENLVLNNVTLDNLSGNLTAEQMENLLLVPNTNLSGSINVTGTVSLDLARRIRAKFPLEENDTLYITFGTTVNISDIYIGTREQVNYPYFPYVEGEVNTYLLDFIAASTNASTANNFGSILWEVNTATNAGTATINSKTGLLTVLSPSSDDNAYLTVTCTITPNSGNTPITKTVSVYLREHVITMGDYVFADATFSDIDNRLKTVVGACVYVSNQYTDTDNKNKKYALIVSTANVLSNLACKWGPTSQITGTTGLSKDSWTFDSTYTFTSTTILTNYAFHKDYIIKIFPYMDDSSNRLDPGVATIDTIDSRIGYFYGDLDWAKRRLSTIMHFGQYDELTNTYLFPKAPIGHLCTLSAVLIRDRFLFDPSTDSSVYPTDLRNLEGKTYMLSIRSAISTIYNNGGNTSFIWQAFSLCNAYLPTVLAGETLDPAFFEGKWFLPTITEMYRWYQWNEGSAKGRVGAYTDAGYRANGSYGIWSANKGGNNHSAFYKVPDNKVYGFDRGSTLCARPFTALYFEVNN